MSYDDIAAAVLECVGGFSNIRSNSLCATRLRISVQDASLVNRNALHSINGVLGIASRGANGLEIVFGPNLVRGVFHSFERLTGIMSEHAEVFGAPARNGGNFQVKITPETPGAPLVEGLPVRTAPEPIAPLDDDTNALIGMLDTVDEAASSSASEVLFDQDVDDLDGMHLLVINGPNVNMLGVTDGLYASHEDYSALLELCHDTADEVGFSSCECYQSNHEGDLIDCIQDAWGRMDGIVINAGSYGHTSTALLDALEAVAIPAIEVCLARADEPTGMTSVTYLRSACFETISSADIDGYRTAILDLAEELGLMEDPE